jgi:hypothetical protein
MIKSFTILRNLKAFVHKWTGIGAPVDHKIFTRKYEEEKCKSGTECEQQDLERRKKEVIRIRLYFSSERINTTG